MRDMASPPVDCSASQQAGKGLGCWLVACLAKEIMEDVENQDRNIAAWSCIA